MPKSYGTRGVRKMEMKDTAVQDIRGLSWADILMRERESKLEAESMKHRQDILFKKIIPLEEIEDMRRATR